MANPEFEFDGEDDGLLALKAKNGETIWHTDCGGAVWSGPITRELDGGQSLPIGFSGELAAWSLLEAALNPPHTPE